MEHIDIYIYMLRIYQPFKEDIKRGGTSSKTIWDKNPDDSAAGFFLGCTTTTCYGNFCGNCWGMFDMQPTNNWDTRWGYDMGCKLDLAFGCLWYHQRWHSLHSEWTLNEGLQLRTSTITCHKKCVFFLAGHVWWAKWKWEYGVLISNKSVGSEDILQWRCGY